MSERKSPADVLADAGRALYGEHWRLPLSRGLRVDDDTIRRWMTGRTELRADHPVFDSLEALIQERRAALVKAGQTVAGWRARWAA